MTVIRIKTQVFYVCGQILYLQNFKLDSVSYVLVHMQSAWIKLGRIGYT